jgi:hypothetical protein
MSAISLLEIEEQKILFVDEEVIKRMSANDARSDFLKLVSFLDFFQLDGQLGKALYLLWDACDLDSQSFLPCEACKEPSSLICSLCKFISYCCYECQKKDWKRHKIDCQHLSEIVAILKKKG